MASVTFNFPA
jgi:hypothetical protein